jgi:hypothetical protein
MRFTLLISKLRQLLGQRLFIALMLSALLHILILGNRSISPAPPQLSLAPLNAKLVLLPKKSTPINTTKPATTEETPPLFNPNLASSSAIHASSAPVESVTETEHQIEVSPPSEAMPHEPMLAASSSVAVAEALAEPAASTLLVNLDETPSSITTVAIEAEPEPQRPVLPKQARLQFDVYQGQGSFKVGEAIHTLDIQNGRYLLKADIHTTGLAGMLKSYRMEQTSSGLATQYQLTPEQLTEEVIDSNGKQSSRIQFNWETHSVQFPDGRETPFPKQAQDILSILYQFPVLKPGVEVVSIFIATSKQAEEYRFEIVFEEKLKTPIGVLQTVHFRKRHKANQEGLEIWFAQEYRLLPVKIRHIDSSGKIAGEAIITDIRVAD